MAVPFGSLGVQVLVLSWHQSPELQFASVVQLPLGMSMFTLTVWLSIVAVPLPAPKELAVNVEVACPLVSVVLVGLAVPSVPPNVIAVPSRTLKPVPPFESVVMPAVRVEVPPMGILAGEAPMLSTSQGSVVTLPWS
jgi:hypothetical protein